MKGFCWKKKELSKYFFRFSEGKDIDKVLDYYKENPHKAVADRTYDTMKTLIEDGYVALIEDKDGRIVASSVSYPLKGKNDKGVEETKWIEIGATRVTLNGYSGFFNALITGQVVRAMLVEPPTDRLVAEMKNKPVQDLAEGLGWRRLKSPSAEMIRESYAILHDKAAEVYDAKDSQDDWFHCGPEGLPITAQRMVEVFNNPVLTHVKTDKKIELSYERSRLVRLFKEEIEGLAKRDMGDVEKPDMTDGLAASHKRWIRDFR